MKPLWVSFYSYKGGVGRSMALANLATLLARKGRRVFMIDFDLEAPGLDSFYELGVEGKKQGVVEYSHEFQKTKIAPDIQPYVQECKFSKPVRGKAWLMPSGKKDSTYNRQRASVNWEELYAAGLGEPFVANWKAAIQRIYKPDYVFVDSRTGLTDVGGICTLHLPDLVVLLFGLNDQNLHGIAAVLQTIRDAPSARPPQILPVATPVPNLPRDDDGILKTRFAEAEKLLGVKIECSISYNPQAALIEKLFTLDVEPDLKQNIELGVGRIGAEYNGLLSKIQERDVNGLDSLIRKAEEACEKDDEATAIQVKQVLMEDFGDRADGLFHVGVIDRVFNGREMAVVSWRKAFEIEPLHVEAFNALVNYYKLNKQFDELVKLYDSKLRIATRLDPKSISALLISRGEYLMVTERYSEAVDSYQESLRGVGNLNSPVYLAALFNLSEAKRRAFGKYDKELCGQLVNLWGKIAPLTNFSLPIQANLLQAMHIPQACLGNMSTARELLDRASKCAFAVGKAETIFGVKTYSQVPVEEFQKVNSEMLSALNNGRLWDGMLLPDSR
jgi:tetratricopeptide (TPR) repeat protein